MASIKHRYTGIPYTQIAGYSVNFKEVFSMDEFYRMLHEWCIDNDYASSSDEDFPEVYYLQKVIKGAKDVWFRWRLKKDPSDLKKQKKQFWRCDFDIDVHVLGLKDVEVVVKNQKFKANKGEVEIQVSAKLLMDVSGEWAKSPVLRPLKKWTMKKVLEKDRDKFAKDIYDDAYDLRDAVTNFFKIWPYEKEPGFEPRRVPE